MAYLWAQYFTDDGRTWNTKVSTTNASDPARGWTALDDSAGPQLPRGWLTRKVYGYAADGRRRHAAVATTDADLWTGVAVSFSVMGNDGNWETIIVIGRLAEQLLDAR